jgi:undecaprenyl-diphosphatase
MYLNLPTKITEFDNYILFAIRKYLKNKYLDILMPIITSMGSLGTIWIIISIMLFLNASNRRIGYVVILTLIVSTLIGEGIVKHIVRRDRPSVVSVKDLLISKPITYSFPSGHTLSSFAAAGVLSVYFTQYRLIFMAIAFLIALSRLYLHVHYPTDVIAGIILGILCSKIVFIIVQGNYLTKFVGYYRVYVQF